MGIFFLLSSHLKKVLLTVQLGRAFCIRLEFGTWYFLIAPSVCDVLFKKESLLQRDHSTYNYLVSLMTNHLFYETVAFVFVIGACCYGSSGF
jgi:hypothetical protein